MIAILYSRLIDEPHRAAEIARIHLEAFPGFFLTFLGPGFLKELYREFIVEENSGVIGAFDDEERLVGFLAYSEDISRLYSLLLEEKALILGWYSFLAFVKKPTIMLRLLRALKYPRTANRNEPYVLLSSIGVLPSGHNKGAGSLMVKTLKEIVVSGPCDYIKVETDKSGNTEANSFYIKHGFTLVHSFTTPEGREMNEYRFQLNKRTC